MWLAYLAGGVITGSLMLLLAWRALKSPTKWDEDDLFMLAFFGGAQVGYGIGEVSLAFPQTSGWFYWIAVPLAAIGALPAIIWRLPKLLNWIMNKEGDVSPSP